MASSHSLYGLLGSYDNLDEPQPFINKQSSILSIVITFMLISWICVIIRLYTRVRIINSPGWDDVFVVLSLLSTTLGSIGICIATSWGMGQHVLLLPPGHISKYLQTFYYSNASYCMSTTFIKISLLLQFMRVMERGSLSSRLCIFLVVVTSLWGLVYTLLAWIPCVPVYMYWERTPVSQQTCFAYGSLVPEVFSGTYESHTAVNMALDLIILAIPVPLYFRPGTRWRTRLALVAVLFMGAVVNLVSIWRLVTIVEHKATTYPTFDPTWYGPSSIVLAAIEVDTAMWCASVPVFWPALRDGWGKIFVTKEVEITHEQRLSSIEDEVELRSRTSQTGSEASLGVHGGERDRGMGKDVVLAHYRDKFTKGAVDPLSSRWGGTETRVETGRVEKRARKGSITSLA